MDLSQTKFIKEEKSTVQKGNVSDGRLVIIVIGKDDRDLNRKDRLTSCEVVLQK